MAILYFENNTGDPSLDWLRTALTNMLVTDLSQSPQMEVLGTDRLYQILKEMNRLDERVTSFDVVQEVAQRANVTTVLLGNFVKAGESIRISVRLQEAKSGKIVTSEKVEGVGESSIFPMVDDLTRRLKTRFDIPRESTPELDRDLKDVTTSSPEAYRYYAEGLNLHDRFKEEEAVPLLEKAVAVDPGFAMALAKLAVVQGNLGHPRERDQYARRALENVGRLTARERYYIEGMYYSGRTETVGRAIEAYQKAVELYPGHGSARHNLALLYFELERYDEATEHYEELRRRGMTYPDTYDGLAACYAERGEFEKGREVHENYLRQSPDSSAGYSDFGFYLTAWGKLDEALEAFQRAESLEPGSLWAAVGRWGVFVLREQWAESEAAAHKLEASRDPFRKWFGSTELAQTFLYRGRSREALGLVEKAVRAYPEPGRFTGIARNVAAHIFLERGELARALEEAQKAQRESKGDLPERGGLFFTALAQAKLGRWPEAERSASDLKRLAESVPAESSKRDYHQLAGELALIRGETALATDELGKAASMLPARHVSGPPTQHAPIWFSLASAYLAAGDEAKAREWFQRVADSTTEHIRSPIPYVRSLYFLGKISEKRGEMDKAREYYRRFVNFWKHGDLDRERVEEAKRKI